jgi:hypothetical protein
MRVKGTLGVLLIVLLALCVFAPAAGAIYIEGQPTPDDGLMHIMSADVDTGEAALAGMPVDGSLPVALPVSALPAGLWEDAYAGETGLPAGFPSMLVADTLPAMLPYEGLASMPAATVPADVAIPAGSDVMGSPVSPALPGIFDILDSGSFQTNMPMLNGWFF